GGQERVVFHIIERYRNQRIDLVAKLVLVTDEAAVDFHDVLLEPTAMESDVGAFAGDHRCQRFGTHQSFDFELQVAKGDIAFLEQNSYPRGRLVPAQIPQRNGPWLLGV